MEDLEGWAAATARAALAEPLPRRWKHVCAVAAKAARLRELYGGEGGLLVAAAWLHDIGYAPTISVTGFHPLDGARYLRDQSVSSRLCGLVAHHSGAIHEARQRGLVAELLEFADEQTPLRDGLWYCDMTTGPSGLHVTVEERLAEIHARYGREHIVSRAIAAATPDIRQAVDTVQALAVDLGIALEAD